MKEMYKIPTQLTLVLLILWIGAYGIVFAQPLCCGAFTNRCIPAFNRIQIDLTLSVICRASLSHRRNLTQQSIVASEILPTNFDADSSCCEIEPCDGFNQITCFNSSSQQFPSLLFKKVGSVHSICGFQNALNQKTKTAPHHLTSIYILTKSIVC